jgi:hypothetical protein
VNVEKVGGQRLQDLELYNGLDTVGELTLTIWLHDRHTVSDPIIKECLERAYHVFRDYPGFLEA